MVASLRIVRDDAGKKLGPNQAHFPPNPQISHRESAQLDLDLTTTNQALRNRGAKLTLYVVPGRGTIGVRGTWTDAAGVRKQRKAGLGCPATPGGLIEAEQIATAMHQAISEGIDPTTVVLRAKHQPGQVIPEKPITVAEAIATYEKDYWQTRKRLPNTELTWERYLAILNRLPANGVLSLGLLQRILLETTEPDSRTRQMTCMQFERLLKQSGVEGSEQLRMLRGNYKPAERELPTDEQLVQFIDVIRPTKWGWCLAAMATFGCRPGEVPSLQLHKDGTADCLSIKEKLRLPVPRTCFAYPKEWIDRWALHEVQIPTGPLEEARWIKPNQFDSADSERWVAAWRGARQAQIYKETIAEIFGADYRFDIYDMRHRWAVRSIEANVNQSLCAQSMGHSLQMHEQRYQRWMTATDLRAAMAKLTM